MRVTIFMDNLIIIDTQAQTILVNYLVHMARIIFRMVIVPTIMYILLLRDDL